AREDLLVRSWRELRLTVNPSNPIYLNAERLTACRCSCIDTRATAGERIQNPTAVGRVAVYDVERKRNWEHCVIRPNPCPSVHCRGQRPGGVPAPRQRVVAYTDSLHLAGQSHQA